MKGDRMPTILSPIALAIGEDYTDQWVEYLLNPSSLKKHLYDLKEKKTNHPDSQSIIKTLLKQYDKYIAGQQIQRSTILLDLTLDVVVTLDFTLDDFEKTVPIKYQRILLEHLLDHFNESNKDTTDPSTTAATTTTDNNNSSSDFSNNSDIKYPKTYEPYLHRWLIRGIIKGVPLKYLLTQNTTSTLSPSLQSQQQQQAIQLQKQKAENPDTPPSTPPPTPPQFIINQNDQQQQQQQQSQHPNIQSGAPLDDILPKSIEYLLVWSKKSINEKDLIETVIQITMELGELSFYRNNYIEARQYFNHSLAIITKYNIEFKYKNKIDSFLLAISSVDVYQETEQSSKEHGAQQMVMLSDSLPTQVEMSLALQDYSLLLDLLHQDILPVEDRPDSGYGNTNGINGASSNGNGNGVNGHSSNHNGKVNDSYYGNNICLDWQFRENLLQDPSIPLSTRDFIFCLNLLRATVNNLYFQIDYNRFNNEMIDFLFKSIQDLLKSLESSKNMKLDLFRDRLKFMLNKFGNSILNQSYYWKVFKSKLPNLIIVIEKDELNRKRKLNEMKEKDEAEEVGSASTTYNKITDLETDSNQNTLISVYIEFMIEENDLSRLEKLKLQLTEQFNLTVQQLDNLIYRKSCNLIAHSKFKNTQTILNMSSKSSSPSIEYLRLLIKLLDDSELNSSSTTESPTFLVDQLLAIIQKQQPNSIQLPDYSILLTILSHLLNHGHYSILRKTCDILLNKDNQQQQQIGIEYQLITITSLLEQLSTLLNQTDKFNILSKELTTTENNDSMEIDQTEIISNIISVFQSFLCKIITTKQWIYNSNYIDNSQLFILNEQPTLNGIINLTSSGSGFKYGILNTINNVQLLESILDIIIGYIFKIHRKNFTQNEINLEYYGELSTIISNSLNNQNLPNDLNDNDYVEILMNTLLRINTIGLQSNHNNRYCYRSKSLCAIGDIYFDVKRYSEALRYYLIGLSMETSFFSQPAKSNSSTSHQIEKLAPRILQCLQELQYSMQAIVVSQFLPINSQLYSNVFKIIQDDFNTLDINYYQYIWDLPILEILLNIAHKQKDQKRLNIITQIISTPMLNEFNSQDIRNIFINNTKNNFWKALSSELLL